MTAPPDPDREAIELPASLRLLKWLVIVLTVVMIVGVITVVGLLVTRMPDLSGAAAPVLPPALALPEGAEARAVTLGEGWIGVVTSENRILIFSPDGILLQEIDVSIGGRN